MSADAMGFAPADVAAITARLAADRAARRAAREARAIVAAPVLTVTNLRPAASSR